MKSFPTLILGLSLAFNAAAELNPDEQRIADMLLSNDVSQLKNAAKTVSNQEMFNPELLDIMAELLVIKYQDAYLSEIDTLAWMARAIGSSENGRYYAVLNEVHESATNKKLRRHADSALDDIDDPEGEQYQAGMYKLPANIYAEESADTRNERIMNLLLSGDLSSLKEGAMAIVNSNTQSVELTDLVAEILITYYAEATDEQVDTFAWMAKALGQSKTGRYSDLLAEVKENGAHRKLRRYAKGAYKDHGEAKGEQYQQGMLGKEIAAYAY